MMPSVHSVPSVVTGEVASLIYHLPICHLPPAHSPAQPSPAQPSPCCPNKVSHILCPGLIWTQTVDRGQCGHQATPQQPRRSLSDGNIFIPERFRYSTSISRVRSPAPVLKPFVCSQTRTTPFRSLRILTLFRC